MPVHFIVSDHGAKPFKSPFKVMAGAEELLAHTWGQKGKTVRCKQLLQSSLVNANFSLIHAKNNGFVDTVLSAYNQHHHLVLRPDDVWIAILGQFNFYVNAHAEELRQHFVAHEGKKELVLEISDFGNFARQMTILIDQNVVDKSLRNWILPDFTTTTHNDTVVCSVLMMATLKAYFNYAGVRACGIPSVTLEGEKEDWEKILTRLDKLPSFGAEPTAWAALLRPICTRFVQAFDGEPDIDFWRRVCHRHPNFSGPTYLSGWLTAFCVWNSVGKWQGPSLTLPPILPTPTPTATAAPSRSSSRRQIEQLVIDGVHYGKMKEREIPSGFCEVPVNLKDDFLRLECTMVSGHIASLVEGELGDTLRPLPAWFMFVHEECEDPEQVEMRKILANMNAKFGPRTIERTAT